MDIQSAVAPTGTIPQGWSTSGELAINTTPKPAPDPCASARELEAIFELTVVGIALLKNRVIVRCNGHMERLFGFTPGEMLGKSTRVWYRDEEEYIRLGASAYPDLAVGRVHSREQYFRRLDGSEFWGRIAGQALDPKNPLDCVLLIEDFSERKRTEEQLRQALIDQKMMFDNAAVGVMFVRGRVIQRCNRRLEEMFGYAPGELDGQSSRIFSPDDQTYSAASEMLYVGIRNTGRFSGELEVARKDGSRFRIQATGRCMDDKPLNNDFSPAADISIIWVLEDVTERYQAQQALARYRDDLEVRVAERTAELAAANAQLQAEVAERMQAEQRVWQIAHHDALTGLPNRSLFQDRLDQALNQARRRQRRVALLFIDLDRFKHVNDTLGHEVGDRLLQEVARRLRTFGRASDTVARLGGDEFVVLLHDVEKPSDVEQVAQKLCAALVPPVQLAGHPVHATASIGIAIFPDDGDDSAALMRNADAAMYEAKAGGRNAARFFTRDMSLAATRHFTLETGLRSALTKGHFALHYQPVVRLADRAIIGLEALLRWNAPEGPVMPEDFLPIAEETGLILPIGRWALREACRQMAAWHGMGLPPVHVAVNLSPRQFRQPGLLADILQILTETGLLPSSLQLEIAESALMTEVENLPGGLDGMADKGIQLAVDDFGTGYSSLRTLRRLAVNRLKIDPSYAQSLCSDGDSAAIVAAIIDLARNLGMEPIAEGIETAPQLEALKQAGCHLGQGYLFSRPLPADRVPELLRKGRV